MLRRYSSTGKRADIDAVDQNRAGGHVVKAANQIHERALAGAAGADQADHFARLDIARSMPCNHLARAVFEPDVAQLDLPFKPARMHRLDRLRHAGHAIENFEDPLRTGRGPLRAGDDPDHRFQPAIEPADEAAVTTSVPTQRRRARSAAETPATRQTPRRPAGRYRSAARPSAQRTTKQYSRRLLTSSKCLLALKRSISRRSCANAFTTRMPGIVSASTLVRWPPATAD